MLSKLKKTAHRKKITIAVVLCILVLVGLFGRLVYLMVWKAEYYSELATQLHERERSIKAARGRIIDCNGTVIAEATCIGEGEIVYTCTLCKITQTEIIAKSSRAILRSRSTA